MACAGQYDQPGIGQGLRRQARIDPGLEYYASLRTEQAIERADVCLHVPFCPKRRGETADSRGVRAQPERQVKR